MFSTLGEERGQHFLGLLNGEHSSRLLHLPELVNNIFSLLCAHDVEPLKHNFSEFLRKPNMSDTNYLMLTPNGALMEVNLDIVQSLIGSKKTNLPF